MKYNKFLIITFFSLSLTAFSMDALSGLYISYDANAKLKAEVLGLSDEENLDTGALLLGYEKNVTKFIETIPENILFGGSLDVLKMKEDTSNDGIGFFNLYTKYRYPISDSFTVWASLGYNFPMGDLDTADPGISYGAGIKMSNGIGLSYLLHNFSEKTPEDDFFGSLTIEGTISRISLSYSF